MATGRRSGGELREALLALVRTTLDQVGAVRSAAVRQAQNQRSLIDHALLSRRRREALSRLGEEVYGRMLAGDLTELAQSPAIAAMIEEVAELDEAIAESESPSSDPAAAEPADWSKSRARHGTKRPAQVWRPDGAPDNDAPPEAPAPRRRRQRAAPGEKRGGIAFVRDDASSKDDLSQYMHEDDVPEKP